MLKRGDYEEVVIGQEGKAHCAPPAKLGLLVTTYAADAHVRETIERTAGAFDKIAVARTTDSPHDGYFEAAAFPGTTAEETFPNLASEFKDRAQLAAHSLARNYSWLFAQAAGWRDVEYVVALTGDTVLLHPYGIYTIVARMQEHGGTGALLGCSKAWGQEFHADGEEPSGGRMQGPDVADFQPQLFVVNRRVAEEWRMFRDIKVTNRWCSEQCLGDAFLRAGGEIADQYVFDETAYGFKDGVIYHAEGLSCESA